MRGAREGYAAMTATNPPTLASIRAGAVKLISEINQLEVDTRYWNSLHPDEEPLDFDPTGEMSRIRTAMQELLRKHA